MTDEEIDVEALQAELTQIKDAMGIQDRYSAAAEIWLFFGVLVVIAAALSQYVHLKELPAVLHTVIWLGVFAGGFSVWWLVSDAPSEMTWTTDGKPNLVVLFAIPYAASVPLQTVAGSYVGDLAYQAESAMVLSIILIMLGVAYGAMGAGLKAYYIRRRDRLPLYVGTVLLVGLGVAIPTADVLEQWAYAVFGGVYFAYALVSYAYLRRG